MPIVEVRAPATSKRPLLRGVSGSTLRAMAKTTMPTGTLTKKTPTPRGDVDQQATEDEAQGRAADGDRGEQPDGPDPLAALGEQAGEQGERGRGSERAAGTLQGTRGEQQPGGLREPTGKRAEGEHRNAGEERALTAEQIATTGTEEQQAPEGQGVAADDPRQLGRGEVERVLDVGKRDVHDRAVEDHHQLGRQDDEEHERRVARTTQRQARDDAAAGEGVDQADGETPRRRVAVSAAGSKAGSSAPAGVVSVSEDMGCPVCL